MYIPQETAFAVLIMAFSALSTVLFWSDGLQFDSSRSGSGRTTKNERKFLKKSSGQAPVAAESKGQNRLAPNPPLTGRTLLDVTLLDHLNLEHIGPKTLTRKKRKIHLDSFELGCYYYRFGIFGELRFALFRGNSLWHIKKDKALRRMAEIATHNTGV